MKTAFATLVGSLVLGLNALAESPQPNSAPFSIATTGGKTYQNCKVLKVYPDGLAFSHAKGIAKLPFPQLEESVRSKFGYDPQKATAYAKEIVAKNKAATAAAAEKRKAQAAARQSAAMRRDGGYDFGHGTYSGSCGRNWPLGAGGVNGLLTDPLGNSLGWSDYRGNRSNRRGSNCGVTYPYRNSLGWGGYHWNNGYSNYGRSRTTVQPTLQFGGTWFPAPPAQSCPVVPTPVFQVR